MAKNKKKIGKDNDTSNANSLKKVVVGTSRSKPKNKNKLAATKSSKEGGVQKETVEMIYGKEHFMLIGLGALLVVIGLLLMSGGGQEWNEWNENEIYSNRRIVLAPAFILAGLIVEVFAIFKKKSIKE